MWDAGFVKGVGKRKGRDEDDGEVRYLEEFSQHLLTCETPEEPAYHLPKSCQRR